jgi:hypothetical protein
MLRLRTPAVLLAVCILVLVPSLPARAAGSPALRKVAYRGALKLVFGDVKQAFIRGKLVDNRQVDTLLDGFAAMGLNGIRVPIMADRDMTDRPQYDYLLRQAKARGFVLFANPAESGGGRTLANGTMSDHAPVLDRPGKAEALIGAVEAFAQAYKVDYIDPLNEDGPPGESWSAGQMNRIYESLKNHLGGAQLVGPCTWGIKAGIKVLNQTDIKNYIVVATTHNIRFDHELWRVFVNVASPLPVWDSEATDYARVPGKATRAEAAVEAGVSGLVMYDSWRDIDMANGTVTGAGLAMERIWLRQ